jgi:hypothetical protein
LFVVSVEPYGFLGAFAKLLKAAVSFVMSVRSVRQSFCAHGDNKIGSHWRDFHEN